MLFFSSSSFLVDKSALSPSGVLTGLEAADGADAAGEVCEKFPGELIKEFKSFSPRKLTLETELIMRKPPYKYYTLFNTKNKTCT